MANEKRLIDDNALFQFLKEQREKETGAYSRDMYNCPNCGAPITEKKCPYCGTRFYNVSTIEGPTVKATETKRKPTGVTITIPGEGVVDKLAREVIQGKWGTGSARKQRLEAAGYDSVAVQARVNQLMSGQGGSQP